MSNYNNDEDILNDILSGLNNNSQASDNDNITTQNTTDVQSQNAPVSAGGNFNKTVDPNMVNTPQQGDGNSVNRAPITVGRDATQDSQQYSQFNSQFNSQQKSQQKSHPISPLGSQQDSQYSFNNTQRAPSTTQSRRPSNTQMTTTDNYPYAQRRSSSTMASQRRRRHSSQDYGSVTSDELDMLVDSQPLNHVEQLTSDIIAKKTRLASVDRQIVIDSFMKDEQIARRLGRVKSFLPSFVMKGTNVKSAFYNIMAVVQKMYIDNLPNNEEIIVSKNANGLLDTDVRSVSNATLMDLIRGILGPSPARKSSVRIANNMVKIDNVISVGNTVYKTDSKLFYCLLKSNSDISGGCFISYSKNVRVVDSKSDVFYRLRKYTDRPYLRYLLSNNSFDEVTKELCCFILENIHMLAFNPKYIIQTDDYVILDVYSLVTNIKHFYYNTDNYLDYRSINVFSAEYRTIRMNRLLPDIAVCTTQGHVNNSTTFAYAFWLYEFKYLALNYNDNTWFRDLVRNGPVTNIDSNLDALCTYQIQAMNDPHDFTNIMTIDSDIQFTSIIECTTKHNIKMKGDLKVFYDRASANNKASIMTYLNWVASYLGEEADNTEYDLFYIYPLLFFTYNTKDTDGCMKFFKSIKGKSDLERRAQSVATLPTYTRVEIVKVSQPVVDTETVKLTAEVKAMLKKIESTMDTTRTHNTVSKVCDKAKETITPTKDKPRKGFDKSEHFSSEVKKKFDKVDEERGLIGYKKIELVNKLKEKGKNELAAYIESVDKKNQAQYDTWRYSTLHKNDIDYRLDNMKRINTDLRLFVDEYYRKYLM